MDPSDSGYVRWSGEYCRKTGPDGVSRRREGQHSRQVAQVRLSK